MIEGILPVLTAGFGDRGNGGVRPAVKRMRRRRWCSVSGDWGHGEEWRRGAVSAVQRGGGRGAFYRAGRRWRGGQEAGGSGVLIPVDFEWVKGGKRRRDGADSVGEVKTAWRRFSLALHAWRRAAVGSAQHGSAAGGAAVPMEAVGGSRWKPEVGADGKSKMARVTKWAETDLGRLKIRKAFGISF
jgi:hypothetical protein